MSPNILLVAGVHGVGKTTYCKEFSKKLQIPHFSASDIIRSQKATALENDTKEVKDADGNQDLLLEGIKNLELEIKEIILDGHFVLIQKDGITRLPFSTFKALNMSKVILLCDDPEKIQKRIIARDNNSQFTVELIDEMQRLEVKYAKEITDLLKLELEIIQVDIPEDQKLDALRQMLIDGENSGDSVKWDIETFLKRMEEETIKK